MVCPIKVLDYWYSSSTFYLGRLMSSYVSGQERVGGGADRKGGGANVRFCQNFTKTA